MSRKTSRFAPSLIAKRLIYLALFIMSATGLTWLVLDNFFEQSSAVGPQKHPWQSTILSLHGISSYFFAVLFGYVISHHVLVAWSAKKYRLSGNLLLAITSLLILSGASFLFITLGDFKSVLTWIHAGFGLGLLIVLCAHVNWRNN